jgi:beta-mannosidase
MTHPKAQEISFSAFDWYWKEESSSKTKYTSWHKCVAFPTVIHHELEEAKLIPDPFVAENECKIQWVGWKDWSFKTIFSIPQGAHSYAYAVLAFDGLDTVAKVSLNGHVILECDNMFMPYHVDVTGKLKSHGDENELYLIFKSNARVAKEREGEYGNEYKAHSRIRDSSRLWIRKAQYHWGWDWGMSHCMS